MRIFLVVLSPAVSNSVWKTAVQLISTSLAEKSENSARTVAERLLPFQGANHPPELSG